MAVYQKSSQLVRRRVSHTTNVLVFQDIMLEVTGKGLPITSRPNRYYMILGLGAVIKSCTKQPFSVRDNDRFI